MALIVGLGLAGESVGGIGNGDFGGRDGGALRVGNIADDGRGALLREGQVRCGEKENQEKRNENVDCGSSHEDPLCVCFKRLKAGYQANLVPKRE
jgi:hypothetical protein